MAAKMKKTTNTRKVFSYLKGDMTLDFTLDMDARSKVKDFKACLTEALNDVELELEKLSK